MSNVRVRDDWRVTVGIVSGGHFLSHFYALAFPPLFPFLADAFGLSNVELGLLVSVGAVATLLQVPVGDLVDRVGAKWVFVAGVAVTALGILLAGLAPSYGALLVFSALTGVGRAAFLFTLAVGIAVAISIIAIMANTVRLTILARKDLVAIMKHVGASETFIRIPFLSEGVIQSFLAAVVAVVLLFAGTALLERQVTGVAFLSPLWLGGFVALAVFLGLCGSALSVRGVLRQVGL